MLNQSYCKTRQKKKEIHFSLIHQLSLHNKKRCEFVPAIPQRQAEAGEAPSSDMAALTSSWHSNQYCLKIKIHGSYPLHTCDQFSSLLWHWWRNGVTADHNIRFIFNGDGGGGGFEEESQAAGRDGGEPVTRSEGKWDGESTCERVHLWGYQ